MNFLKRMPWTISGLILAIVALGNLLQSYSANLRLVLGAIGGILFILFAIKIITDLDGFKDFMANPLFAGVFTTYPMALNLLSAYLKPYASGLAYILWWISVICIIAIMICFALRFLSQRDISKIFASTYIVYAGIAVASITGPAFDQGGLGRIFFWIALIGYIVFTPLIFYRIFKLKTIPESARATNAIITAPLALCIAGYNSSYGGEQNIVFLAIMLIISQLIYFFVLTKLPMIFKESFKPSFAGFTFPIVISAIALKTSNAFLASAGKSIGILGVLLKIEELIAVVVIAYLFVLFMRASFTSAD